MYKPAATSVLILTALLAPTAAHAAVVISEVAWMGTSASANAEWIELQNTDSAGVNLAGWILTANTGSPNITLSGNIAGNGFYLLERTSDATVPTVAADQIYSGVLANTGLTLVLKDQSGNSVDTVVGGTNWADIGGDNTTKQTPQRTGSSWTTADPTPRAANATGGSGGGGSTASSTDPLTPQPSVGGSTVSGGSSANPIPRLYIEAGPGRILTAGVETSFTAHAYDSDGSLRSDADFSWSFGDGAGGEGDTVAHTYTLPGTYTVSIHAAVSNSEVVSLLKVAVYPSAARITSVTPESVTIKNDGAELLDMSGWKMVQGNRQFVFPRYMTLMPGQEVTLPSEITQLGASTNPLTLLFPNGKESIVFTPSAITTENIPEMRSTETEGESVTKSAAGLQPIAARTGIEEGEDARLPLDTINQQAYVSSMSAPSATAGSVALGASAGSAVSPSFLTSPWTVSFMGLLVAAASILVIL